MYDDLIKRLRNRRICIQQSGNLEDFPLLREAADTIETCSKWHDTFADFLASLTTITHGKQQYFEQDNGKWYSRISGEYLTTDEMISEYLDEMSHYLD